MLINFTLSNWMSFRDTATLTTIASKERQHGERLPKIKKYPLRLLPITAIYGGNASGKTNLFQALKFAKYLIVEGIHPDNLIPRQWFRLDNASINQPTEFVFDILIEDTIYQYSFSVTSEVVIEEKLVERLSTRDKIIYHRYDGKPHFNSTLAKDDFLKFAFKGTRDNQLFLTNTVNQQIELFKPIYDWFKYSLELIAPDERFEPFLQFIDENDPLFNTMNKILTGLDTGIIRLGNEEIKIENIDISDFLKTKLNAEIKEGETVKINKLMRQEPIIISRKKGELIAKKLISYHHHSQQEEIPFEIDQESDGTKRIIDLIPVLLDLINPHSNKVFIIDEIDRSLHTLLTRKILETYLDNCHPDTQNQLIFTTHDLLLMDQRLLRRDEMWITERKFDGNTTLISLSEYDDIRYDKDIRKSYLQGRMGGIPRINPALILSKNNQKIDKIKEDN